MVKKCLKVPKILLLSVFLSSYLFSGPVLSIDSHVQFIADEIGVPALESVFVAPNEMKWTAAPVEYPNGAQMAILIGQLNKIGPLIVRIKVPSYYKFPPHFYNMDIYLTVLSGALNIGSGDVLDESKGKLLPAGSFAIIRGGSHTYSWTTVETVVEMHTIGPINLQYINPQDDPRISKQKQ